MRTKNINIDFDTSSYSVTNYDRMFLYIWIDTDEDDVCKFGQRWVLAGDCPVESCAKRVYDSLGVRKDRAKIDEKIMLVAIFDATEIAKQEQMFSKKAKFDDYIREKIGFVKNQETHNLPGQEMKGRVADVIKSYGVDLIEAGLSTKQYDTAVEVCDAFEKGMQVVLAELCARFGKTIWSGAVAIEQGAQLTIVASYVKTVFTSFANDLKMFNQFSNCVHVDMGVDGYEQLIDNAIDDGKKVFAYLSLCNGEKRQERINYLFGVKVSRMLIIDEADFGAHTLNQAEPLIEKITNDDCKVVIMTGTNADRAVTHWNIDTVVSVTYPELLIQKKETQNG